MTRMSAFCTISVGVMLVASTPALGQAPVLTFGLIGDLGYRPAEEPLLQNVLDDLNNKRWRLWFTWATCRRLHTPAPMTWWLAGLRSSALRRTLLSIRQATTNGPTATSNKGLRVATHWNGLPRCAKFSLRANGASASARCRWFTKARARTPCFRNTARTSVGPLAA